MTRSRIFQGDARYWDRMLGFLLGFGACAVFMITVIVVTNVSI